MLTITIAVVIAMSLAGFVLAKSRGVESNQLDRSRHALLAIGVQIICGDCSGDDSRPTRTFMTRDGSCSQCGGTSYLLASTVYANNMFSGAAHLREVQLASSNGRVIPFEIPGSRTSRSEKIAVAPTGLLEMAGSQVNSVAVSSR
jgi:hypothetical protein